MVTNFVFFPYSFIHPSDHLKITRERAFNMTEKRQFNKLTDYHKSIIRYLTNQGKSVDEIREDDQLRRADGTKILKKTVEFWMDRYKETGDMKAEKKPGRKRILNEEEEENLMNFIENNSEMPYTMMANEISFKGVPRSLNNYALRNDNHRK